MTPHTNTFLSVTGQSVAIDGDWFAVPRLGVDTIAIAISLKAGTATWIVQGRSGPSDDALQLDTGTADEAILVPRFPQMRVILSAATGAQLVATSDRPMKAV